MSELLTFTDILELIPERAPLVMLDRLRIEDGAETATGVKCVTMEEAFFPGHFPGGPIMPGVLQVAGMAQAGGVLLKRRLNASDDALVCIKSISRVKFRKPVLPGNLLQTDVELTEATDAGAQVKAKVSANGQVASQGTLDLVFADPGAVPGPVTDLAPALHGGLDSNAEGIFETTSIADMIPHRFPFLLIDRILAMDLDAGHVVGLKNVSGNAALSAMITVPVFPGYLQAEAAAQAACAVALSIPGNEEKLGYFMSIDKAVFHAPVVPGDQLLMDLALNDRGRFGIAEGSLYVGDRVVTEVVMKFALVDRE